MKRLILFIVCLLPLYAFADEEVMCLAETIYFEARGESVAGQLAVGLVVFNRVEHPKYPDTVCGVTRQAKLDHNGRIIRHACQFSYYCDGKEEVINDNRSWNRARVMAEVLMEGYADFTEGATHYHSKKVSPWWTPHFEHTSTIGQHIFYK